MFIGHFGVGFAGKKYTPATSLGTLFIAAQFLDLLWPTLLLLDVEHVAIKPGTGHSQPLDFIDYPISHSLVMVILWSLLFGVVYWAIKKNKKAAVVLACCVFSHWVLDYLVHLPDLPLYPGNSPLLGLSLWNSKIVTVLLEGFIFITGILFYLQTTRAKNKTGSIVLWILISLLAIFYVLNLFGPPPPGVSAIAWGSQAQWLFVILAYWADNNRAHKIRVR
jgi:FtsH-binding integral membrane protein